VPTLFTSISGPVRASLLRLSEKWTAVKLDGKVTVQELVTFVQDGIHEAMVVVAPLADDTLKKKLVMEFAEYLFGLFLPFLKQTWFGWLFSFFGEDTLKQRFLDSISLLIEIFYNASFKPKAA
jgi:hypothetical protein